MGIFVSCWIWIRFEKRRKFENWFYINTKESEYRGRLHRKTEDFVV